MDSLIDRVIHHRYRIQSLLGRQVGRRTFLATDLETQTSVVVKLLLFGPDFTWDDFKHFEREAATLKVLTHQAIPRYLDSFELDTELGRGFVLVQTYIEAKSLQEWMQSGQIFSEVELKAIAQQLLDILDYLHQHQPPVIHRDIKPSNVLLANSSGNSPGQIYLVDFGSVQTTSHGGTVTVVGTYGYMPPEQFYGQAVPASDLYSLGATLVYLLTRTHPADLPTRRGQIQFEPFSTTSKSFQSWLRGLIHPDIERRFDSSRSALAALSQGLVARQSVQIRKIERSKKTVYLEKAADSLMIYACNPPKIANSWLPVGCAFSIVTIATFFLIWYNLIWLPIFILEMAIGYWFEAKLHHSNYEMWRFEGHTFTVRQLAAPVETIKTIDISDIQDIKTRKVYNDGEAYCYFFVLTVEETFTIPINSCREAHCLEEEIKNWLNRR
ncbi:serine/threonine protein kinase [Nodosilinea sp. LEGE 07088]|uniref:serine/threonine protein kinase n=1 Tax=Nodosilinea sp. LEGE 07088 TaxID=2777968 RepID=UPI0018820F25|nr:serine/threonine-protein kinase [Nodosilinea sp. LEGE 07088]MBE9137727.1 serine/threonine protein kinase [Nodosilinea sp. LEGE 07088]